MLCDYPLLFETPGHPYNHLDSISSFHELSAEVAGFRLSMFNARFVLVSYSVNIERSQKNCVLSSAFAVLESTLYFAQLGRSEKTTADRHAHSRRRRAPRFCCQACGDHVHGAGHLRVTRWTTERYMCGTHAAIDTSCGPTFYTAHGVNSMFSHSSTP